MDNHLMELLRLALLLCFPGLTLTFVRWFGS